MAETKQLEVMVGKKPTADLAKDKIGKTHAKPQQQEEVGGRYWVSKWVVCPYPDCGAIGWVEYDTQRYHGYTCHACGRTMIV